MTDIVILGGGASGLIAAVFAKYTTMTSKVVVAERLERVGKKILATGNGRCNYTNMSMEVANFHGGNRDFIENILKGFTLNDTLGFFKRIGVEPRVDERGRVYPYSLTASSVLDALRIECERVGVNTLCSFDCVAITSDGGSWQLRSKDGKTLNCATLIVAAGGRASPALGSDGSGFNLMSAIGLKMSPTRPALVQLQVSGGETRALKGIKVEASASIICKGETLDSTAGEILFTDNGLSGTPVFQLSVAHAATPCGTVILDICPSIRKAELLYGLHERRIAFSHLTVEHFFTGLLQKRVGFLVMRRVGIDKLSAPVSALTDAQLSLLCDTLKGLEFQIIGTNDWSTAQVTAGGVLVDQLNPDTLQARLLPNLHLCGEILDVFGNCGGYNLQWAWSTGAIAGRSAASSIGGR